MINQNLFMESEARRLPDFQGDQLPTPNRRILRSVPDRSAREHLATSPDRPLAPIIDLAPSMPPPEPAPWTATAEAWNAWVKQRDEYVLFQRKVREADEYAKENDLRGTF